MTQKKLVLLAYPKMNAEAKGVSLQPPVSLLYLAAVLQDEYEIAIYDHRLEPISRYEELLSRNPICVGISSFTGKQIKYARELAQIAKDSAAVTVMGGIHAGLHPQQTQQDPLIDYVISGDGEIVFKEFLKKLTTGQPIPPVMTSADFEPVNLDTIGLLPYDLINVEEYINIAALPGRSLPFLFSRGCPYKCTFCCNPALNKSLGWRKMTVETALAQLDELVEEYHLDGIFFHDENLSVNVKLLNQLAAGVNGKFKWAIQARADGLLKTDLNYLEDMGLIHLGIGIESGSPRILKAIRKEETVEQFLQLNQMLAQTGIDSWYNYMVGFPQETHDDIRMTVQFAMRLLDENPIAMNNTFYTLAPYPGTEIGEMFEDQMPETLAGWADFDRHNCNAPWHDEKTRTLLHRITFSSKFVGRRLTVLFDNPNLRALADELSEKWRAFDFFNDEQWQNIEQRGWKVLKEIFGKNAY